MESFEMSMVDGRLRIDGFPDAAAVVKLEGSQAQRIADLARHVADLTEALEWIDAINPIGNHPLARPIREALWRSAIVAWRRCFNEGVGTRLRRTIYPPGDAQDAFDYFRDLRDMHIAHDLNSYSDAIPAAIVTSQTTDHKIEKVIAIGTRGVTIDDAAYSNLRLLVTTALETVESQFDAACEAMTTTLEALDHTALMRMPPVQLMVPAANAVGARRR